MGTFGICLHSQVKANRVFSFCSLPRDFSTVTLICTLRYMYPLTSDVEHGVMAVASVGDVGGNTTEDSSIHLPHACHLEDPHWQESVPGHGRRAGAGEALSSTASDFRHNKLTLTVMSKT